MPTKLPPLTLSRANSTTVSTRVAIDVAEVLRQHARDCGANQAVILRRLIHACLTQKGDSADALASIVKLLGLDPETADRESILNAVEALLVADGSDLPEGFDPGDEAMSDTAQTPPPNKPAANPGGLSLLSRHERDALAKITERGKRADFIALRAKRRGNDPRLVELAYCERHGLTPDQFAARKASAVRQPSK